MTVPDVVVVIVTYDSADHIVGCLESVERHTSVDHHVVVVDNASHDGTADVVAERFPEVELVRSETNLGFAGGVNLGARQRRGRYVLLLNPDTELRSPAIDELVRMADSRPDHRIYGGRTLSPDGDVDPRSAWGLPTMRGLVSFALGLTTAFKGSRVFDPESLGSWPRDTLREVGAVSGCFQLIDHDLWTRLGGLDERYFMYGEDADWAIRARAAGARPILVPSAEIMHEVGASSSSEGKRVMVMTGKATVLRRHWGPVRSRIGLALLLAGTLLRGPLANCIRRLARRTPDTSWEATWQRRREWLPGWSPRPAEHDSGTGPENRTGNRT